MDSSEHAGSARTRQPDLRERWCQHQRPDPCDRGEIGYMVTDIQGELPEDAVELLEASEQNIRLRVLKREY